MYSLLLYITSFVLIGFFILRKNFSNYVKNTIDILFELRALKQYCN